MSEIVRAKRWMTQSSLSEFHALGQPTANARWQYELILCRRTTTYWCLAEWRCHRLATSEVEKKIPSI